MRIKATIELKKLKVVRLCSVYGISEGQARSLRADSVVDVSETSATKLINENCAVKVRAAKKEETEQ